MARKKKPERSQKYIAAGFAVVVIALALAFGGTDSAQNMSSTNAEEKSEIRTGQQTASVPENQTADYYLQRESQLQESLSRNEQNSTTHAHISLVYWQLHKKIPSGGFNESAAYHERRSAELRAAGK